MLRKSLFIVLSVMSVTVLAATGGSPYAGQQQRTIKALSENEINGLLAGKGMGLAKAGELNHYPGPKHVLELKDELQLSAKQLQQTQQLFSAMEQEAMQLGRQIVDKEKQLNTLFANQTVSAASLEKVVKEIGGLRAELRYVHLKTHLQQRELLTAMQLKRYDHLRGYADGQGMHHQHMHH